MTNASRTKSDASWTSSSHRATALIAAYLLVLGTMAFVGFMWNLGQRLRAGAGAPTTFCALFVALALVATLIRAAIPGGKQFGSMAIPTGRLRVAV